MLATCDYLSYLNAACIRKDRRFWPVVEARVQVELHDILLGWIEASSERAAGRPVDPGIAASAASWSIFGAALDRSRDRSVLPSGEFADRILPVIVEGLRF